MCLEMQHCLTLIWSSIIEEVQDWDKYVKNITALQHVEHEFLQQQQQSSYTRQTSLSKQSSADSV